MEAVRKWLSTMSLVIIAVSSVYGVKRLGDIRAGMNGLNETVCSTAMKQGHTCRYPVQATRISLDDRWFGWFDRGE